jgi:hypothetical protein
LALVLKKFAGWSLVRGKWALFFSRVLPNAQLLAACGVPADRTAGVGLYNGYKKTQQKKKTQQRSKDLNPVWVEHGQP